MEYIHLSMKFLVSLLRQSRTTWGLALLLLLLTPMAVAYSLAQFKRVSTVADNFDAMDELEGMMSWINCADACLRVTSKDDCTAFMFDAVSSDCGWGKRTFLIDGTNTASEMLLNVNVLCQQLSGRHAEVLYRVSQKSRYPLTKCFLLF